jgi:hypothetical protein
MAKAKYKQPWFEHDYNSRNDPKLVELRVAEGYKAVAIYWCIVEMLYEQGGSLNLKKTKSYANSLHITQRLFDRVVTDYDLFSIDGDLFYSQRALENLGIKQGISDKRRDSSNKRWDKKDAIAMPLHDITLQDSTVPYINVDDIADANSPKGNDAKERAPSSKEENVGEPTKEVITKPRVNYDKETYNEYMEREAREARENSV